MTNADDQTPKPISYADAGVSIEAGDALVAKIGPAAKATARPGVMGALGGFGALFDLKAAGYRDPLLVAGTDGVGTKLKIAIETGILSGVGVDLVAMCANDLLCQGAEPLFFLDYYATGKLDPPAAAQVVEGIAKGCADSGCALIGGETAEMPGLYPGGDFDLAGFCVGAVERDAVLPRPDIPEGAALLGLASDGAHSNGYSLIRRIVADQGLAWDAPAPFDPSISLGEALLTPTRLYAKPLLTVLKDPEARAGLYGLAHITGGGLVENPGRALPPDLACEIDLSAWARPALFDWLAECGPVAPAEMARAFNGGVGFVLIVEDSAAAAMAERLQSAGETVYRIGRTVLRAEGAPPVRLLGADA